MRTTLLLSSFIVAGGFLFNNNDISSAPLTVASYKVTKARKKASLPLSPMRIVIDKSDYELQVFDAHGWYATYPVVFGNDPMLDKKVEGDRCTPEGSFKIQSKKPHAKWSRFMLLDYPNGESLAKFNARKQRGEIPMNARPGGGVGIHGTYPHEDFIIDRYKNWTLGCISLKNADVQELYGYLPVGTTVTIKK
ncbi:MAG TPA: L,D-transpeptidase [Flavisolibacter sp.]|jgi:murein L,D-transpeptidase YafK|nr:L,D-transpeptidase [Flavisolibacter sp.]